MKTRLLIFVLVIGFGAVAVGWVYESRLATDSDATELSIPDNIDYFLTNLNYRAMDVDGKLDFEFNSRRLEHFPVTDISQIEVPNLLIYRSAEHWQIDAQSGEFRHGENLLRLQDQVVMLRSGANPIELRTQGIRFEPDQDLISSEARITMHTPQLRIEAEHAVFDLAAGIYRFSKTQAVYDHSNR